MELARGKHIARPMSFKMFEIIERPMHSGDGRQERHCIFAIPIRCLAVKMAEITITIAAITIFSLVSVYSFSLAGFGFDTIYFYSFYNVLCILYAACKQSKNKSFDIKNV